MAGQIFHVLTEFRFETGSALLGTQKLQSAVEGVSSAADDALISFQRMGIGLVAQLGLGGGGLLGVLGKAIQSFDKFKQSQLALANVMGTSADPFEQKMADAEGVLLRINKLASEFALPADDLINMTKVIGPMLNNQRDKQGRGLAGPGFSTAVDLSRNLLKSAPTLGVDPGLVSGQMQNMIGGHASMGDTLFQRLVSDTQAMSQFKDKGSKGFNALEGAERVKILSKALKEFASDTKILEANVNTLRGQFTLLQNNLTSAVSILRPLGEALLEPILKVFRQVNAYLGKEGAEIIKQVARGIGPLIANPDQLLGTLMQAKDLKRNLDISKTVIGLAGSFMLLSSVLGFLGITIPSITSILGTFGGIVALVFGGLIRALPVVLPFLGNLAMFLLNLIPPFLLLFGVLNLISRALALAKIADAKKLAEMAPLITKVAATFARIFDVFNEGFGKIAEIIAPAFMVSGWIESFVGLLESLSEAVMLVMAGFQGLVFGMLETIEQAKSFITGGGFNGEAISDAFNAGMDEMIERIMGRVDSGEGGTSKPVVNINKVEIRNDFKEQQEPDRIAFQLKDQLLKTAQNPTQRRGGSLQAATVGR